MWPMNIAETPIAAIQGASHRTTSDGVHLVAQDGWSFLLGSQSQGGSDTHQVCMNNSDGFREGLNPKCCYEISMISSS